jgi:hypothetical protein
MPGDGGGGRVHPGFVRISLEFLRAEGDRLEGRILTADGRVAVAFSGTLDLLRVIEELHRADGDAAGANARPTPVTAPQP